MLFVFPKLKLPSKGAVSYLGKARLTNLKNLFGDEADD